VSPPIAPRVRPHRLLTIQVHALRADVPIFVGSRLALVMCIRQVEILGLAHSCSWRFNTLFEHSSRASI
jgi:hypothetical protein